ncbi:MAG: hypothetical protein GF307_01405 [candidate division Zixibacteria bacterium]|nr:hypothetical protein [candidate division Zixibacteria bacterium]
MFNKITFGCSMICLLFFIISAFESIIANHRFTHLEFGVILISIAVASTLFYIHRNSANEKAKVIIFSTAVLLLVFDWLALHDISSGEASTTLEYAMLFGSIAVFMVFPLAHVITNRRR